jgi:hypothetical protein
MLGDGVGKEVWLIKSRADLVSDVTWVVLQGRHDVRAIRGVSGFQLVPNQA